VEGGIAASKHGLQCVRQPVAPNSLGEQRSAATTGGQAIAALQPAAQDLAHTNLSLTACRRMCALLQRAAPAMGKTAWAGLPGRDCFNGFFSCLKPYALQAYVRFTTAGGAIRAVGRNCGLFSELFNPLYRNFSVTPQAYVRFTTAANAMRAVGRDCGIFSERFGQRYVHVYAVTGTDMADLQATALTAAEFEAAQQVGFGSARVARSSLPPDQVLSHICADILHNPGRQRRRTTGPGRWRCWFASLRPCPSNQTPIETHHKTMLLQTAAADGGSEAAAVLLRNFPPEAGQAELATFFQGFRLHANGLQVAYHGPTTRTGQASTRTQPNLSVVHLCRVEPTSSFSPHLCDL